MQATPTLYKNMMECVTYAHRNSIDETQCVNTRFFKVLNNKEIVDIVLNQDEDEHKHYGFLHLNQDLEIVHCSSQTQNCLIEVLKQASEIHASTETLGYFKLLNEDEIVYELHIKY